MKRKFEFLGPVTVSSKNAKVAELIPALLRKKSLPANTPVQLYEEVRPGMVEPLDAAQSFNQAELSDGDIVCFQIELSPQESVQHALKL